MPAVRCRQRGATFTDGASNVLPVSGNSASGPQSGTVRGEPALSAAARAALLRTVQRCGSACSTRRRKPRRTAAFVIGAGTFDVASRANVDGYTSGTMKDSDSGHPTRVDRRARLRRCGRHDKGRQHPQCLGTARLIAGKIVWSGNGTNDTLDLYNDTDLTTEPTVAIATVAWIWISLTLIRCVSGPQEQRHLRRNPAGHELCLGGGRRAWRT